MKGMNATRPDQSIKSDTGKPIDKSVSIDKIMFIDIDCIGQSTEIHTHNVYSKINRLLSISIDFIDSIDRRKTFNFGINTAFYLWYRISYEITRLLHQTD